MSVVSLPDILDPAFEQRYGVVAFNAVDDVTMDGLIRAADAARSPLIIQTSVKTIRSTTPTTAPDGDACSRSMTGCTATFRFKRRMSDTSRESMGSAPSISSGNDARRPRLVEIT